ncbi:type VII secretion protein EccB [Gordonia sp. PP30]|uniref:type VII secretion protein EccB n=1 Tax=unclassified Gordonia (in: high G+C Gram-positive bacteria) TaxID=2657482 RepID=UPI001FFECCD5|nr:type VII secretion protein EccB [Gordonia sp. PP30]UQE74043.1 type VII secretion protein EccB [Gordonia sp. PP30]
MPRQLTTRAQVSGYRFGLSRAEHALIRRDARMLADPMRSELRALIGGAVIALVLLAGAGIYGIIRPAPSVADAEIVAADTGGLFVLVDGVMHPVPNLASARLVIGEPSPVKNVTARSVSAYPRGPSLGIPGAPAGLPGPADRRESTWTVCDDPAGGTAVIAGRPAAPPASARAGVLVRAGDEEWLLYQLRRDSVARPVRARLRPESVAVRRALGLDGVAARPVSAALLNAFPAEPELAVPEIPGAGGAGPATLRETPVGTVVRSLGVDDAPSYFAVLADGVQPLTPVAAEALRGADATAPGTVTQVAPAALASVPVVHRLPLDGFPEAPPDLTESRAAGAEPVLCRSWSAVAGRPGVRESLLVTAHLPLPGGARVVTLSAADGGGPGLDGVYLRPGTGEQVAVPGGRYYITDAGVRYPIADADTAQMLGLPAEPEPAPWPVVSLLPAGPQLSREAALVARDLPR